MNNLFQVFEVDQDDHELYIMEESPHRVGNLCIHYRHAYNN